MAETTGKKHIADLILLDPRERHVILAGDSYGSSTGPWKLQHYYTTMLLIPFATVVRQMPRSCSQAWDVWVENLSIPVATLICFDCREGFSG